MLNSCRKISINFRRIGKVCISFRPDIREDGVFTSEFLAENQANVGGKWRVSWARESMAVFPDRLTNIDNNLS